MRWLGVLVTIILLQLPAMAGGKTEATVLRVLSFNMWHGGEGGGMPLEQSAEVIRASRADVAGIQEAYGREREGIRPDNTRELAKLLGWHHVDQGGGKTILSRHPIEGLTPGRHGALIRLPDGQPFYLFNVHLYHTPYQPYQLLKIPYNDAPFLDTADALIAAAEAARGPELAAALAELKLLLAQGALVALTGDFNEPSHLDWTARALAAGLCPMEVPFPASRQVVALGMADVWRSVYPDETDRPGHTWTPTTKPDDPADRHDRIDFVYASPRLRPVSCEVVGEAAPAADITLSPYPSDHRAVVAALSVNLK